MQTISSVYADQVRSYGLLQNSRSTGYMWIIVTVFVIAIVFVFFC